MKRSRRTTWRGQLELDFRVAQIIERRRQRQELRRRTEEVEDGGFDRDRAEPRPGTDDARHVAHCCSNHGCAYGDDECPIVALLLRQRSACGAAAPCTSSAPAPVPRARKFDFRVPEAPGSARERYLTGGTRK